MKKVIGLLLFTSILISCKPSEVEILVDNGLLIEHTRHGKMKLKQLYNTIFSAEGPIGVVEIKKDKNENILGLTMSNGRTRNVWFKSVTF